MLFFLQKLLFKLNNICFFPVAVSVAAVKCFVGGKKNYGVAGSAIYAAPHQ
jgi:hypothetical protein